MLLLGISFFVAQSTWAVSLSGLVISEVLADPTGFDANNDGAVHLEFDEYVEIFNGTGHLVELDGFKIRDMQVGVRHIFGDVTIGAGEYIVVFGGPDISNAPGNALVSSEGTLKVTNKGDVMKLLAPDDSEVDVFVYQTGLSGESRVRHDGEIVAHTEAAPGVVGSPGFATAAVPEPTASLLLGSGLLGLCVLGRRRS